MILNIRNVYLVSHKRSPGLNAHTDSPLYCSFLQRSVRLHDTLDLTDIGIGVGVRNVVVVTGSIFARVGGSLLGTESLAPQNIAQTRIFRCPSTPVQIQNRGHILFNSTVHQLLCTEGRGVSDFNFANGRLRVAIES